MLRRHGGRACTVSFVAPPGVRAVEVAAESLYEAAILGIALLREDEWADQIAQGTQQLEIEMRAPATTHCVTVAQLRRWCEGITVSPEETLKKRRLRQLLD